MVAFYPDEGGAASAAGARWPRGGVRAGGWAADPRLHFELVGDFARPRPARNRRGCGRKQAKELEQVIAAGFTHRPAEELARRLADALPAPLRWVFYSDDGSTAVEVALKLAYQFWRNQGERNRTRFLRLEGAYHGDTLGAMSVGERSLFTRPFADLLFPADAVPFPATWEGDGEVEAKEARALARLEELLAHRPGQYAAMILEPLVQGAGGMRMCRPHFLVAVQALLRQCDVLAIYDEVLTGFGRTGALFACEKAATQPDIICLAKGLTGGFLPMAATVCSQRVFSAFYHDDPAKAFYHGHSYTANPLGCAAALASLDLLAGEHFRRLADWQREEVVRLREPPAAQAGAGMRYDCGCGCGGRGRGRILARDGAAAEGAIFSAGVPVAATG